MIAEFRDFISKGNFVDIAVAFVIGAAFGAVVATFTTRVVTPAIGMLVGVPDLNGWLTFGDVDPATGAPAGSVGALLQSLLNFVIVALVMFLVVKAYNRFKAPAAAAADAEEVVLLREIRDQLAARP